MGEEIDILDLGKKIHDYSLQFKLTPFLWNGFDLDLKKTINPSKKWREFKYVINGSLNPCINTIPNNCGGIYTFYIKSDILKKKYSFLVYVGRAHYSDNQNLRKRIKEYLKFYTENSNSERPKLMKLFKLWGENIYCRYLKIDPFLTVSTNKKGKLLTQSGNELIDSIEAELINNLLPPCNSEIPNVSISKAIKAFS